MEYEDSKRKCIIDGCNNVGEWNRTIRFRVYRRPLCGKHHRKKYGKMPRNKRFVDRMRELGLNNKCSICGWNGPCDFHRKNDGGPYNKENTFLVCPNCHRLIHRNLIKVPY